MRKFTSLLALMLCFFLGISAQAQTLVISEIGDPIVDVSELEDGGTYLITSIGRHNSDGWYLYEDASHYLLFESVTEGHDANAALTIEVIDDEHIYIKSQTGYYIPPYADPRGKFQLSNIEKEPLLIQPIDGAEGQFTLTYTTYSGGSTAYAGASTIYLDADAANLSNWSSISAAGGNGAFRIVPVTLGEPEAYMQLDQVLAEIEFDGSLYQADVPGGYPLELIDACQEAYDAACDIQADYDSYSDEEIIAAAQALRDAYNALLAAQIQVGFEAGNYYLVSARIGTSNNLLDNVDDLTAVDAAYGATSGALWEENFDATLTGEDAEPQYIWQIESAGYNDEGKGLFTIKNLAMGQYLNSVTVASASYGFTANVDEAAKFVAGTSTAVAGFVTFTNTAVTTEYGALHAAVSGKKVVNWTASSGGSAWYVVPVDDETIAAMDDKIEELQRQAAQQALNDTLQKYFSDATAAREAGRTFTFDGTNDGQFEVGDGLLLDETQIVVNPADPDENNSPGLFDGDYTSFIHTSWHASVAGTEPHYLQMDLGEEVETLVLKYAVRSNAGTPDVPYVVTLYGTNDESLTVEREESGTEGEDDYVAAGYAPSSEWEELGQYTLSWQYPLLDADGNTVSVSMRDNIRSVISTGEGAGVTNFELPAAYRYIRMAVNSSIQSVKQGSLRTNGDGFNYWCLSELRAYSAVYDPDCVYAHMDPEAIAELEASLDAAKAELDSEAATQETIDRLKAAYEAFMAVFPDRSQLQSAINDAKTWSENAVEGDEIGNYNSGALDAFRAVIDEAEAALEGTLTYTSYNTAMNNLSAAVSRLAGQLVLPQTGYYTIQSLTTGAANGSYLLARNSSVSTNTSVSGLGWGCADKSTSDYVNTLWYVEKLDNGNYTFKNVATGYYMQNTQTSISGGVAQGEEPCEIGLRAARDTMGIGLNLIINSEEGFFGNAQPGGSVFVTWTSAKGNDNSAWYFEPASFGGLMTLDLTKPVSIYVLPYEVMSYGDTYSVAGVTEDGTAVALNSITTIPAGTPFVAVADTSVTKSVQLALTAASPDEVAYVREALTVDGLVGTFEPDTVNELALVMNRNCTELIYAATAAYQVIAPGSGYFIWSALQALPKVSGGDQLLALNEALQTGIENVMLDATPLRRQGVYTLQGQKIADTRNLPAGVYIINGRKVLVK